MRPERRHRRTVWMLLLMRCKERLRSKEWQWQDRKDETAWEGLSSVPMRLRRSYVQMREENKKKDGRKVCGKASVGEFLYGDRSDETRRDGWTRLEEKTAEEVKRRSGNKV